MTDISLLKQRFPLLDSLDAVGLEILERARQVTLPADQIVFHQGDECSHYIMVVAGTVRVMGRGASGREIVLYRIEEQGSCVLTTSCLLGGEQYPAEGITETDVSAFMLSAADFQQALAQSEGLRRFIFDSYAERLAAMIGLVQEIAFERIDQRLAKYLIEHSGAGFVLLRSHQDIADELGTAREVVSRHLKALEQKEWLALSRNQIMFLNKDAIRVLAGRA